MMTAEQLVTSALLVCLAGAVATCPLGGRKRLAGWVAFGAAAAAAGLILWAAGRVLEAGPGRALVLWTWERFGFALRLYVDGLSAVFLVLIAVVAVPAVFYSIRYMEHYRDYGVGRYYPNLLLFLAGMIGLVTTTDAMFFFFIFWQMMTLTSYALIRHEHRRAENLRAANRYLVMMQLACGLTMVGAEVLAAGTVRVGNEVLAKYDFDAISHHLPRLLAERGWWVGLAFGLFLAGFGIKAGMWPFGRLWLPDAHPAAPSPVSALLSGVMIKTGVYGLMRYFLWLVPAGSRGEYPLGVWGLVIASLGVVTLFTGTFQALKQEQSKRLLAFHSIGQVGYILLGLGACMTLMASPLLSLATLAFYGALFHTLNHGIFKGLLFLNAGSVLYATGTQDLNRLGGLMRYMPVTAVTTLVASFSIAGVPLFNGFASKWSLYSATLRAGGEAAWLPVFGVVAVLTSALTLASFIKFYGTAFLSRTSSLVAEKAQGRAVIEGDWHLRLPQIFLAALCLLLGLFPMAAYALILAGLNASQQGLGGMLGGLEAGGGGLWQGLEAGHGAALFRPLMLAGVVLAMLVLARYLAGLGGSVRRVVSPWFCGYAPEAEVTRYSARHYYTEFKRLFKWAGGVAPPDGQAVSPPKNVSHESPPL